MQGLKVFNNNEFGEIRTIVINEEPYFMLTDVCRVLEINNPSQAKTRLNDKGVISNEVLTESGRQKATFINEPNLYKLAFQSRKPQAERFSDWVTGEILPSIRKHGTYMTDKALEKALANPDFIIGLATKLKEEKEKRNKLEEQVKEDRPKVLFAESVEASEKSISVGNLAKIIKQNGCNTGQNRLFTWLRKNNYLIGRAGDSYNMPTQKSMEMGLFEIKEGIQTNPSGKIIITKTPKVTGKGQIYFIEKFTKN